MAITLSPAQAEWFAVSFNKVVDRIDTALVGKKSHIRLVLCAVFAAGHVLIEDMPGTGKTVLGNAIAASLDGPTALIHFNPDLTAIEVVGHTRFDQKLRVFEFLPGPVFASFVLADQIDQGSSKVVSALFDVMDTSQASVDGVTHSIGSPHFILATQNPLGAPAVTALTVEHLDRFLMKLSLGYPGDAVAVDLLLDSANLRRASRISPIFTPETVIAMQVLVDGVFLDPLIAAYINDIAKATQRDPRLSAGVSMRGALGLARASKAWALSHGRSYVIPQDIRDLSGPVLAHRIVLNTGDEVGDTEQTTLAVLERILIDLEAPERDWAAVANS